MIDIKIKKYFERADIPLTDQQKKLFALYYKLITDNNEDNDLTRIHGEDNFIIKHFVDSVFPSRYFPLPDSLIDIGTGAGFPGIPLKIMNPGIHLILAEQRSRRVEFLKLAVSALKLRDVEIYPHKVTEKSFFNVDGVITRALEDAPETLDRVEHFLPWNGVVIFLKGPDASCDLLSLTERNKQNYRLELDREYMLPDTDYSRRILVFRKESETFKKIYKIMKDVNETIGTAITSPDNKTFRDLKKITCGEWSRKKGFFVITGKKIIQDYILNKSTAEHKMLLPDEYIETDSKFDYLISSFCDNGALFILKKSLYNELNLAGSRVPLLISPLPEIKEWDGSVRSGCTPVIPFQDPVNVGSSVRSAVAFCVRQLILASQAANPLHPKSVRSSSGAVFNIEFVRGPSLDDIFQIAGNSGIEILSLDKNGKSIFDVQFPEKFILVTGKEGQGLPDVYFDKSVSIPVTDKIESLNASVALSVYLYEYSRKRN
jgi:16S rRNA (guanine(527)-N(7))-methyltransferase RsmG